MSRLILRFAACWLQVMILSGLMVSWAQASSVLPTLKAGGTENAWDRLIGVNLPGAKKFSYTYDHRARRVAVAQAASGGLAARYTAVTFSGGLSVAEFDSATAAVGSVAAVQYIRGPDMGGGVGGLLRTVRNPVSTSTTLPVAPTSANPAIDRYNLSNGRGDVVAQSNALGELTWTASYEAYGKRTKETGQNADKQRANTKDEDPTGLLNEGFRYRDLETGVWLSRDPAGFVDGPNLYAYVQQNPWSKFDAEGMFWSAIVTAGFAAYDTYQYATGQTSGAEYSKAMALNGAALLADVSTGGMGGGLALRALNAGVKVAKAVDKADTIYSTANGAIRTAEAIANGDGKGAVINGMLTAVGAKQMGRGGKAPEMPGGKPPSAPSPTSSQKQVTEENEILFRGVHGNHPDLPNARNGEANPMGGHSDPKAHNDGEVDSEFTSWTTHKDFAEARADTFKHEGKPGVVLEKSFLKSVQIKSPDVHQEGEKLIRGKVTGAKVEERD